MPAASEDRGASPATKPLDSDAPPVTDAPATLLGVLPHRERVLAAIAQQEAALSGLTHAVTAGFESVRTQLDAHALTVATLVAGQSASTATDSATPLPRESPLEDSNTTAVHTAPSGTPCDSCLTESKASLPMMRETERPLDACLDEATVSALKEVALNSSSSCTRTPASAPSSNRRLPSRSGWSPSTTGTR